MRNLMLSLSRMPPFLMLLIILGLAVVVTMLVMQKMGEGDAKLRQIEEQRQAELNQKSVVVIAKRDIKKGDILTEESLGTQEVPAMQKPQGVVENISDVTGMRAAVNINTGTQLMPAFVEAASASTGTVTGAATDVTGMAGSEDFSAKLKDGMRAVTFPVDGNSGVGGWVLPGSHVDICCTVGSGPDMKTGVVLSNVEVIAAGSQYRREPGPVNPINTGALTVALSPDDSQKLIEASQAGKLYLMLRKDNDNSPLATTATTALFPKSSGDIGDLPAPGPDAAMPPPPVNGSMPAVDEPPPPPPLHEIEVWSGSRKDVLSVPKG